MTNEEQKKYDFRLMGEEILPGRKAYHIGFVPKNKNAFTWTERHLSMLPTLSRLRYSRVCYGGFHS
jgi:hypothetical protein